MEQDIDPHRVVEPEQPRREALAPREASAFKRLALERHIVPGVGKQEKLGEGAVVVAAQDVLQAGMADHRFFDGILGDGTQINREDYPQAA
jgi:hypothetical protein